MRVGFRAWAALAPALALGLGMLPGVACACPVCMAARDEAERLALLGTTVFLTALPVIMIGGLIIWIARRTSSLDTAVEPEATPAAGETNQELGSNDDVVVPLRRRA